MTKFHTFQTKLLYQVDKISSLGQPITDLQVRGLGLFVTDNEGADLVQLTSFKEDYSRAVV